MIGNCDNCDRQNVPVSHFPVTYCGETTQCFLCQGDSDPDPYGELDDPVGQSIRGAFASLDELIALAASPDTKEQVCAEKIKLGQMLSRCELLLSFVKAQEPTGGLRLVKR